MLYIVTGHYSMATVRQTNLERMMLEQIVNVKFKVAGVVVNADMRRLEELPVFERHQRMLQESIAKGASHYTYTAVHTGHVTNHRWFSNPLPQ